MNTLSVNDSLVLIIDIQEKLVQALNKAIIVEKAVKMASAAKILNIPIIVTEQYPKGLGATVQELKDVLSDDTQYLEKTSFNALLENDIAEKIKNSDKKQIVIFGIEFDNCLVCGKKIENEKMAFSTLKGGVICGNCLENIGANVGLNYKIRDFLKEMLAADFDEVSSYEIVATEKVCIVCFNLLKDYISLHCSKKFKTLDMLAQVV